MGHGWRPSSMKCPCWLLPVKPTSSFVIKTGTTTPKWRKRLIRESGSWNTVVFFRNLAPGGEEITRPRIWWCKDWWKPRALVPLLDGQEALMGQVMFILPWNMKFPRWGRSRMSGSWELRQSQMTTNTRMKRHWDIGWGALVRGSLTSPWRILLARLPSWKLSDVSCRTWRKRKKMHTPHASLKRCLRLSGRLTGSLNLVIVTFSLIPVRWSQGRKESPMPKFSLESVKIPETQRNSSIWCDASTTVKVFTRRRRWYFRIPSTSIAAWNTSALRKKRGFSLSLELAHSSPVRGRTWFPITSGLTRTQTISLTYPMAKGQFQWTLSSSYPRPTAALRSRLVTMLGRTQAIPRQSTRSKHLWVTWKTHGATEMKRFGGEMAMIWQKLQGVIEPEMLDTAVRGERSSCSSCQHTMISSMCYDVIILDVL